MTKEQLGQLIDLRKEIKELDEKVERLQRTQPGAVVDKVQASMKEFPYVQIEKTIRGIDEKEAAKHRRILTNNEILLLRRRQQAIREEQRLSKFIEGIKDSRIRRIVSLRYEDGLPWAKVAEKMNCDRTYPEKILTKYLEEHKEGR